MMSEKLKPCPFCGGVAEHDTSKPITRCSKCRATTGWGGSEEYRTFEWNRRAQTENALLNGLKSCPFCGARPILRGIPNFRFVCCGGCGIYTAVCKTDEKAINAWNRRTNDE